MQRLPSIKKRIISWGAVDLILIVIFLIVLFIFCNRFLFNDQSAGYGRSYNIIGFLQDFKPDENSLFSAYLLMDLTEDTYPSPAVLRPPHCRLKTRLETRLTPRPRLTAILTFSDYEFFAVRRILEGVARGLVRASEAVEAARTEGNDSEGSEINFAEIYEERERESDVIGGNNKSRDDDLINAWRYVTEDDFARNSDDAVAFYDVISVVDDASSLRHLVEEYSQYFRQFRELLRRLEARSPSTKIPKFLFSRHEGPENLGVPAARMLALEKLGPNANGVLVFVDPSAAYNKFWLGPLVRHVTKYPNSVAQPHLDKLRAPVHAQGQVLGWSEKTEEGILNTLTWTLSQKRIWSEGWSSSVPQAASNSTAKNRANKKIPEFFSTPLLKGSIFVVRESFFRDIGGYETEKLVPFGGGHDIDLSLKIWTGCGGRIDIVSCSRVAVENLHDFSRMRDVGNVKQLANRWLNRQQRNAVFGLFSIRTAISEARNQGDEMRNQSDVIRNNGACGRDFDWFRSNVAGNLFSLGADAVRVGALRVQTSRCGRLVQPSNKIKLDECSSDPAYRLKSTEFFEMTAIGQIKVEGRCLATKTNAFVKVEDCVAGDSKQLWIYRDEELVNVWSSYCAMHVTDPDPTSVGDRQIMMVQDCKNFAGEKEVKFKRWNFLVA